MQGDYLGKLVQFFESGNRGNECVVQSGYDCGMSFGAYQLTWRWGNMLDFMHTFYSESEYPELSSMWVGNQDINANYYPGSWYSSNPEDAKVLWLKIYNKDKESFDQNVHQYIYKNFYYKLKKELITKYNYDPDTKNRAMQECVWAWAVHRGYGGAIKEFDQMVDYHKITDVNSVDPEKLFDWIYDARYYYTGKDTGKRYTVDGGASSERCVLRPYLKEDPFNEPCGSYYPTISPANPQEGYSSWVGKITTDGLNVRTLPGVSHPTIPTYPILNSGNLVDVLAETILSEKYIWYGIRIDGKYYGWVSGEYIIDPDNKVGEISVSSTKVYLNKEETKNQEGYPTLSNTNLVDVVGGVISGKDLLRRVRIAGKYIGYVKSSDIKLK